MAAETYTARERKANPLNSERARVSGHTRSDYRELYNAQKDGIMTMYANGQILESDYNSRMAEINRKIKNL